MSSKSHFCVRWVSVYFHETFWWVSLGPGKWNLDISILISGITVFWDLRCILISGIPVLGDLIYILISGIPVFWDPRYILKSCIPVLSVQFALSCPRTGWSLVSGAGGWGYFDVCWIQEIQHSTLYSVENTQFTLHYIVEQQLYTLQTVGGLAIYSVHMIAT